MLFLQLKHWLAIKRYKCPYYIQNSLLVRMQNFSKILWEETSLIIYSPTLSSLKFTGVLGVYRIYTFLARRQIYVWDLAIFFFSSFSYLYLLIVRGSTLLNYTIYWLVIYIHIYPNNFALYSFNITQIYSLNPKIQNLILLNRVSYISGFLLKIRQRNQNFIIFLNILSIQNGVENKKKRSQ